MKQILFVMVLVLLVLPTSVFALTDGQRYRSGYQHGCSDAQNGLHYLAGSGGSSAHTASFMTGYNDGFRHCSGGIESIHNSANAAASASATASANGNTVIINNGR